MSHRQDNPDIRKYLGGTARQGDRPWTTGRCNRLLRPITAQIKALREIVYPQLNAAVHSAPELLSKPAPSSKTKPQEDDESKNVRRRKGYDDPDWVPSPTEKRGTKRLYSNRCQMKADVRSAPAARRPGEISMPTPLLIRHVKFDETFQHPVPLKPTGWQFLQTPKKRRFSILKRDEGPALLGEWTGDQQRHAGRLVQAFRSLIDATSPSRISKDLTTGASSLLSTCLRQVPVYIEGRQMWEDEENSEKVDVSEEVYQELEMNGSATGWKPLREVVRAHGVALLTAAITENLLDTGHIEELVRICHPSSAFHEADEILSAFAFATAPLPPPKTAKDELIQFEDLRFRGISAAYAWAERAERWSFFYRLVRNMLLSNLLPNEWTATARFKHIWSRVIRHISDSSASSHAEACKLFNTVLSLACGRTSIDLASMWPDEAHDDSSRATIPISVNNALNTTVSSLSAIFAAIFLMPDEEASYGREGRHEIRNTLEGVATDISYDVLCGRSRGMVPRWKSILERLSNIITCSILISVKDDEKAPHIAKSPIATYIRALTHAEETTGHQLLNLPAIVCSVAETCGKAYPPRTSENVFQVLKSIVEALKSYRVSSIDDGRFKDSALPSNWESVGFPSWFLKRLALDAALQFANHSQDSLGTNPDYFNFAFSVEREMQEIDMPQHNIPFFRKDVDHHVSYRWESGISEWVEATPLARSKNNSRATSAPNTVPKILVDNHDNSTTDDEDNDDDILPPSSPIRIHTPARPTLSQLLLLANTTPDVLSATPIAFPAFQPRSRHDDSDSEDSDISADETGDSENNSESDESNDDNNPPSTTPTAFSPTSPVVYLKSSRTTTSPARITTDATDDDEIDELAPTSPVQEEPPTPLPPPPRKRARRSGGSGGGYRTRRSGSGGGVRSFSAAFGLNGAGGSESSGDELGFV